MHVLADQCLPEYLKATLCRSLDFFLRVSLSFLVLHLAVPVALISPDFQLHFLNTRSPMSSALVSPFYDTAYKLFWVTKLEQTWGSSHFFLISQGYLPFIIWCPVSYKLLFQSFGFPFFTSHYCCFRWEGKPGPCNCILVTSRTMPPLDGKYVIEFVH